MLMTTQNFTFWCQWKQLHESQYVTNTVIRAHVMCLYGCPALFTFLVSTEVGDRLRISKESDGPWTCVVLKCLGCKKSGMGHVSSSVALFAACSKEPAVV